MEDESKRVLGNRLNELDKERSSVSEQLVKVTSAYDHYKAQKESLETQIAEIDKKKDGISSDMKDLEEMQSAKVSPIEVEPLPLEKKDGK